jgi:hypothetical protein
MLHKHNKLALCIELNKCITPVNRLLSSKFHKGLVSRIYIFLRKISELHNKNPIFRNWAKYLNQHFTKEDIQITSKCTVIGSTSLVFREMQS